MKSALFNILKKWHRIISIFVSVPLLIIFSSGILLGTRGFFTWVQPSYPKFNAELKITFDEILKTVSQIPEAEIKSWSDVSQIDIRPESGNIRVRSKSNNWEVQIRGDNGQIMNSAPRRVSFLVQIHEGALWGKFVRYGVFLSSALGALFLLISGVFLLYFHYRGKLFKTKTSKEE